MDDGLPKIDRNHSTRAKLTGWSDNADLNALTARLYAEIGIDTLEKAGNRKPLRSAKDMLLILLTELYSTWLVDPSLATGFSKDKSHYKVKSRYNKAGISEKIIKIVAALVDAGYLDEVKGHFDRTKTGQNYAARIRPSSKLRHLFAELQADQYDIDLHRFGELIILREKFTDEDDEEQSRSVEYEDTELTISWREQLEAYNALLRRTFIDIPTFSEPVIRTLIKKGKRKGQEIVVSIGPDNKRVHRVFNGTQDDNWKLGGRFYGGWWLQVPKENRPLIHLNDKPTVEVDYKALHPNLLLDKSQYDPYDLGEIVLPEVFNSMEDQRSVVKGIVLMGINAKSVDGAFGAFRTSRKGDDVGRRLNNQQLQKLLDAFTDRHPKMKEALNTGQGLNLMNTDSVIANMIIDYFTQQNIPVLCVHDSFIIQHDEEEELKRVMDYATAQVNKKAIPTDSKSNTKKFKLNLRRNHKDLKVIGTATLTVPVKLTRSPQYEERMKQHNRRIKVINSYFPE